MKRIYLLLLITLIPINLFCQQDNALVLDSVYGYDWDLDSSEWILEDHRVYTYDAGGNLITEEILRHSLGWRNVNTLTAYTYDANGNLTELNKYFWNTKDWVEDWKEESSYDSNGHLTEMVSYHWDQKWVLTHKHQYSYDADGNLTEYLNLDYHVVFVEGDEKEVWSYDANGNQLELISYAWNSNTKDWVKDERELYTYDTNGNLTELNRYDWDSNHKDWAGEAKEKEVWSFDANGNQLEHILYSWNSNINDWVKDERGIYTYDSNGNLSESIDYSWNSEIEKWINKLKEVSYWSELSTSISTKSEYQKCIIYPNPTNSLLTIETEQHDHHSIEIASLNGQLIYSTEMEGTTHQIDLSSFQKGIYLITIRSEDFVTTRKVIKL